MRNGDNNDDDDNDDDDDDEDTNRGRTVCPRQTRAAQAELFYRAMGRRTPKSETKLVAAVLFYGACGCSAGKLVVGRKENRTHHPLHPSSLSFPRVQRLFFGESERNTIDPSAISRDVSKQKDMQKRVFQQKLINNPLEKNDGYSISQIANYRNIGKKNQII